MSNKNSLEEQVGSIPKVKKFHKDFKDSRFKLTDTPDQSVTKEVIWAERYYRNYYFLRYYFTAQNIPVEMDQNQRDVIMNYLRFRNMVFARIDKDCSKFFGLIVENTDDREKFMANFEAAIGKLDFKEGLFALMFYLIEMANITEGKLRVFNRLLIPVKRISVRYFDAELVRILNLNRSAVALSKNVDSLYELRARLEDVIKFLSRWIRVENYHEWMIRIGLRPDLEANPAINLVMGGE